MSWGQRNTGTNSELTSTLPLHVEEGRAVKQGNDALGETLRMGHGGDEGRKDASGERQTDVQTDIHTDRETYTQTERHTHRQTYTQTERHRHRQTYKEEIFKEKNEKGYTDRETGRKAGRQTGRSRGAERSGGGKGEGRRESEGRIVIRGDGKAAEEEAAAAAAAARQMGSKVLKTHANVVSSARNRFTFQPLSRELHAEESE
eukprot:753785-Hanusia_phi.AAC.2